MIFLWFEESTLKSFYSVLLSKESIIKKDRLLKRKLCTKRFWIMPVTIINQNLFIGHIKKCPFFWQKWKNIYNIYREELFNCHNTENAYARSARTEAIIG